MANRKRMKVIRRFTVDLSKSPEERWAELIAAWGISGAMRRLVKQSFKKIPKLLQPLLRIPLQQFVKTRLVGLDYWRFKILSGRTNQ